MQAVTQATKLKNYAVGGLLLAFVGGVYSYTYAAMKTVRWRLLTRSLCSTSVFANYNHALFRTIGIAVAVSILQNELAEISAELDSVRAQQSALSQHAPSSIEKPRK